MRIRFLCGGCSDRKSVESTEWLKARCETEGWEVEDDWHYSFDAEPPKGRYGPGVRRCDAAPAVFPSVREGIFASLRGFAREHPEAENLLVARVSFDRSPPANDNALGAWGRSSERLDISVYVL